MNDFKNHDKNKILPGPHFTCVGNCGFHICLSDGWDISVQFGPGNYCQNESLPPDHKQAAYLSCPDAELTVFHGSKIVTPEILKEIGYLSEHSMEDTSHQTINYCTPDFVGQIISHIIETKIKKVWKDIEYGILQRN